jgi:hypothetical protein
MQYVLGNMLNGGGINPDGLSLDLQFAADKTLTARRGPTPVFTRSSGDNGGTTYFGPLVDLSTYTEFSTTGITNGRASWFKSEGGNDITISYTGARWRFIVAYGGIEDVYLAAPGSEWRPDQADWSGQDFPVTTSSTFGIVNAANNEPRFDHDPVTLACKGLLIEEGRTNLFSSTNLNDWSASRVTRTAITGIGLTNQATTLTISALGGSYIVRGATLTTGVAYAISVRVKAGTITSVSISDLTDGKQSRGFNPVTGQWTASGGPAEFTNYTVTPNIDGWFLVSAIYTPTGATGVKNIAFVLNSTTLGQTVSFDTPQIEAGSFPTSYIPTTTGSVARSADVCDITGGDFNNLYNQSEGTLLLSADEFRRGVSYPTFLAINNSAIPNANRINIGGYPKTGDAVPVEFLVASGGTNQYSAIQTSTPSNFKAALAYKLDDARAALNGALAAADAPPSVMPIGANNLRIGGVGIYISSVRYYRKRLPNAKLVTLTT